MTFTATNNIIVLLLHSDILLRNQPPSVIFQRGFYRLFGSRLTSWVTLYVCVHQKME